MRIHLLSIPNTVSAPWYSTCIFTQKVVRLAKMLTSEGHHVIHYGHEFSHVECAEHVTVSNDHEIEKSYGVRDPLREGPPLLKFDDPIFKSFTSAASAAVGARKQPGDILLATFGGWHKAIALDHPDLICIEPGIGYPDGAFSENRVFESYAIMHAYQTNRAAMSASNEYWYDAVIPIAFDTDEFTLRTDKENYLLFMGRMHKGKGLHVAEQIAEATKTPLIVAGFGEPRPSTKYVNHIGVVAGKVRDELIGGAKAMICASHYLEPFGAAQIEAQLCGTPVISSDWGAFAEYNPHGLTGYRCKSFEQFCWAANHAADISPVSCRRWAERFSLSEIAPHYTDYFKTVKDAYGGNGWYEPRSDRKTLRSASFSNDFFF